MGCCKSKDEVSESLLETLAEHTDSINCMAMADDESLLVTGSEDKTARMWTTQDSAGSECLGVLEGHTSFVSCVYVFDTYVFTGSNDNTIKKWDMTTCNCDYTYEGHTSQVMRIICSGEYIISSSKDLTAKVWLFEAEDLDEDENPCIHTLRGHTKGVHPLIYVPAGETKIVEDLVFTGSADCTARMWSLSSGECLQIYRGHRQAIMTMTADSDARILFTGSADTTIRSWDIRSGKVLKIFDGHTTPIMCLSVVNKLMYSGDTGGMARCWAWNLGDCTQEYRGHKHSVTCLKFYQGILYSGCGDGKARGFEAKTGTLMKVFATKDPEVVINCLAICNNTMFTGSRDGKLRVWDIKSKGVHSPDLQNDQTKENQT
ncbi:WD repeat-containing protein 86-like [Panulirus ornatus]|uniref:WD repeat-containing protein 86-like n=1 Tax=Panulirus ornatus TaxID=150431 RepID=UPI003A8BF71A